MQNYPNSLSEEKISALASRARAQGQAGGVEGRRAALSHRLWGSPQRVRTYLVLFALALVLPLLLIAGFALQRMAAVEEAETERRVVQIARNLTVSVDQEFDRALVTLETLAVSSELRAGDLRGFHEQAALALKTKKAAIVLIDRSFQQLVDTLKDFGAALPPTADTETAQRVFDTGQPQVSNLFRGSVNGLPVFNVEIPVFDSEQHVQYVLIMSFQAAHISDLLEQVHLSPGWIAGVTDRNGKVLARSERAADFVGSSLPPELFARTKTADGVYEAMNVAGEPILRATARSERSGWYVSATVPIAFVQEPRLRGYLFVAALMGIALVLSWILAYVFARLMARPLDDVTQAAAAVGRGEDVKARETTLTEAILLFTTLADASRELRSRSDHANFLMRELAHRAKNQLAVVKGMALQTARANKTVDTFIKQFDQRIQGLAESQDILMHENWRGGQMSDLVRAHLELFGMWDRVTAEGPAIYLDAAAIQNIGFALHELATNATKHGALSVPLGKVAIRWTRLEDGGLRLSWAEAEGPPVEAPMQQGFGLRVIAQLVPRSLDGAASFAFDTTGFRWDLMIPEKHVVPTEL